MIMPRSYAHLHLPSSRRRHHSMRLFSNPRGLASVDMEETRQRPTHGMTRQVLRQRPTATLPKTREPEANIQMRPSNPPRRSTRVPYAGAPPRTFSRPR